MSVHHLNAKLSFFQASLQNNERVWIKLSKIYGLTGVDGDIVEHIKLLFGSK